ncbi:MAG: MgtC/SapB family protein [Rhodocyclaceae bacterium]|nr:MgtC/SapB family protein [Rhodocyclaceae bacterium]
MNGFEIFLDSTLGRVLAAAVLGGLIGLERDKHGRAAGLRTHLLVSLGAAVFTILSAKIPGRADGLGFVADPGRIAAQVVTGIGFLGAGVILKTGRDVRGLTTAACLWTAAAVGMAAGAGQHGVGVVTTVVALLALILLKLVEHRYAKDSYRHLVVVTPLDVTASQVIDIVRAQGMKVLSCEIRRDFETARAETRLAVRLYHRGVTDKAAHAVIAALESSGVRLFSVHWGLG